MPGWVVAFCCWVWGVGAAEEGSRYEGISQASCRGCWEDCVCLTGLG